MKITIDNRLAGISVKEYLFSVLGLSRNQVIALKKDEKGILLNDKRVTVRASLCEGDILELRVEDDYSDVNEFIEPVELPLDIIYEDEELVAVNKPSGMPTHPSHGHHNDTLANALSYYYLQKGIPFVFRAVNRLDMDTSGVVLVAKNKHSAYLMAKEMEKRNFIKEYCAVLSGELFGDGKIENYIRRKEGSSMLRCICNEGAASEYAKTEYSVISRNENYTVVRALPYTGRTHQLRVHFSSLGNPILGDGLYGAEDKERLMLHAYALTFVHPVLQTTITLKAPMPNDFMKYLKDSSK